jgi:hypothetical protein
MMIAAKISNPAANHTLRRWSLADQTVAQVVHPHAATLAFVRRPARFVSRPNSALKSDPQGPGFFCSLIVLSPAALAVRLALR